MNEQKLEKIKEFNEMQKKHVDASIKFILLFVISWLFLGSAYSLQNIPVIFTSFSMIGLFGALVVSPIFGFRAFRYSWRIHKLGKDLEK